MPLAFDLEVLSVICMGMAFARFFYCNRNL